MGEVKHDVYHLLQKEISSSPLAEVLNQFTHTTPLSASVTCSAEDLDL